MLLPPNCLLCGTEVSQERGLCSKCWPQILFITKPQCLRCGLPFFDQTGMTLCGSCIISPPPYTQARAAIAYNDACRILITRFKRWDRTDFAPTFARWIIHSNALSLLENCDVFVVVPLHPYRLFTRRFNQSVLLAKEMSKVVKRPVLTHILQRRHRGTSQVGLNVQARLRNIRGLFHLCPRSHEQIKKRRVVLIDDILTTGATVSECTRVLLQAGAEQVSVVTLARTAIM